MKSTLFNNFFLSHNQIDDSNATLPPETPIPNVTLENIIASEEDLLELIKNIKVNKSTGPDGISPRLLNYGKRLM